MRPGEPDEAGLLARAAAWPGLPGLDELTPEALRQVADQHGIDFATALLYQRLRASGRHGPFITCLEEVPADGPAHARLAREGTVVAVVPGAFYRERPATGGDGGLVRGTAAGLGYATALVPLPSFDHLAGNAAILANWLKQNGERPVILVSSSKGAITVRQTLARPDAAEAFRRVRAWVNLSGLYHGTPLVAWLRRHVIRSWLIRLFCWYRGYTFAALEEIDRAACLAHPGTPAAAPHLQVIHVVGFPLRRHLTVPLAHRGHRRLTPLGPNDSVVLLADVVRLPGLVYPVWGADHYLAPPGRDMRLLVARILSYLAQEAADKTWRAGGVSPLFPTATGG